jgi:hypothetical protein
MEHERRTRFSMGIPAHESDYTGEDGDLLHRRRSDSPGHMAWRMDIFEDSLRKLTDTISADLAEKLKTEWTVPSPVHRAHHDIIPRIIDWIDAQKEMEKSRAESARASEQLRIETAKLVERDHEFIDRLKLAEKTSAETKLLLSRNITMWVVMGVLAAIFSFVLVGAWWSITHNHLLDP